MQLQTSYGEGISKNLSLKSLVYFKTYCNSPLSKKVLDSRNKALNNLDKGKNESNLISPTYVGHSWVIENEKGKFLGSVIIPKK